MVRVLEQLRNLDQYFLAVTCLQLQADFQLERHETPRADYRSTETDSERRIFRLLARSYRRSTHVLSLPGGVNHSNLKQEHHQHKHPQHQHITPVHECLIY